MLAAELPQWLVRVNSNLLESLGQYGYWGTVILILVLLSVAYVCCCEWWERRHGR